MRHLVSTAIVIAVLALALDARASHYALGDVPTLVDAAAAAKLDKVGIKTTEELITKAGKSKDRKALAKVSGLKTDALLALARRCDLLRLRGIGPEMVLLLEAASVRSAAELGKKDAATLIAAVTKANDAKKISQKPPTQDQLAFWIDEAKKLPAVLETK